MCLSVDLLIRLGFLQGQANILIGLGLHQPGQSFGPMTNLWSINLCTLLNIVYVGAASGI